MKRIVSFCVIIALLSTFAAAFALPASAAMLSPDALGGYENICLTYTFDTSVSTMGRHGVNDLLPYVAYIDENGSVKDFFFDSYLFLPCVEFGPSGANMHALESNPTLAEDWTAYVNDTFADGYNVDALDAAMGTAKKALNNTDKKAGVFFTILYPCATATNFGTLGGRNLNFSKQEDRKYAIKWIIDEQLRLYNEAGYENLEVVGFYWLEEYLYNRPYNQYIENELFQYASQYLHSLGLKFLWIPYYQAYGYNQWSNLGFDAVCYQPNMYWQGNINYERVQATCDTASSFGMGVEIEADTRVFTDDEYFNRYLIYLEDGMNYGAMDSIKAYYQDRVSGAVYKKACYSNDPRYRTVYNLTYKYAKGTLTQEDIDKARSSYPVDIGDLEAVSIGKSYTATTPYYENGALGYQQNDGTELTDGEFGMRTLGTEWHGFHYSLAESNGRMQIIVDLGKVYNNLTFFYAQFCNYMAAGIGNPADVRLEISEGGDDFSLLKTLSVNNSAELFTNVSYECDPVSARFVKLSFTNSTGNFVFCSEFLVCADPDADVSTPDPDPDVIPENAIYISAINKKVSNGDCVVFTSDFGNVSAPSANHVWTYNVVAKWDSAKNAYIVTSVFEGSGDSTPTITLDDDEILIAAHPWEGEGLIGSVAGSNANVDRLKEADIGEAIILYGVDTEANTVQSNAYAVITASDGILGDVNNDGVVDMFDYLIVKSIYFEKYTPTSDELVRSDVNSDGAVDMFDYLIVKNTYFAS